MSAPVGLLALALLAAPAPGALTNERLWHEAVDALLAQPEYRHLRRYREQETGEPRDPGRRRERPAQRERRAAPEPAAEARGTPAWRPPELGGLADALTVVAYAALAGVLAYVVSLVLGRLRRGTSVEEPSPRGAILGETQAAPGEQSPDEWLLQATERARTGQHREAVRLLLLGAMSSLERRGLVRARRGLTNGDYLRAASGVAGLRAAFEPIVGTFDETHFGRRPASAERFAECLRHYRAGFGR